MYAIVGENLYKILYSRNKIILKFQRVFYLFNNLISLKMANSFHESTHIFYSNSSFNINYCLRFYTRVARLFRFTRNFCLNFHKIMKCLTQILLQLTCLTNNLKANKNNWEKKRLNRHCNVSLSFFFSRVISNNHLKHLEQLLQ